MFEGLGSPPMSRKHSPGSAVLTLAPSTWSYNPYTISPSMHAAPKVSHEPAGSSYLAGRFLLISLNESASYLHPEHSWHRMVLN